MTSSSQAHDCPISSAYRNLNAFVDDLQRIPRDGSFMSTLEEFKSRVIKQLEILEQEASTTRSISSDRVAEINPMEISSVGSFTTEWPIHHSLKRKRSRSLSPRTGQRGDQEDRRFGQQSSTTSSIFVPQARMIQRATCTSVKVRSPTPDSEHTGAPGFAIDWTLPPLSAEAFLCSEPVRGRHGTQQKYALQRLVTAARDTDEGWSNALARIKTSTESFTTLLAAARKVDSIDESTSRMVAIQGFTKQRLSVPSSSLPDFTVRVIQALNYAKLWDHGDAEKGGKTWKTQALWLLFVSANATHGLSSSSIRKEQSDGVQEAYEKFKKQHDRLIQHRKLLLRLYNTFGAGVLIDRQWDYDNCVRSYPPAYLRDLVEQVEAELPTAKEVLHAWKEKYSAMETVMIRVLTKVGDPSVATYAQEFMEGMPPTWRQLLTYH